MRAPVKKVGTTYGSNFGGDTKVNHKKSAEVIVVPKGTKDGTIVILRNTEV